MRVNVYAEEITDRIEIVSKEAEGQVFTGLRLYMELPATVDGVHHRGPFLHKPGDDDSAAVTFWGKRDLRDSLHKAIRVLDEHYARQARPRDVPAIGSRWPGQGGIYAGLVRGDDGQPDYHLIVAEPACGEIPWKDAGEFAAALDIDGHRDFTLPKRKEQSVLFGNVPEMFEKAWYWSSEPSAGDDASAWLQSFVNGYQYDGRKGDQLRARAVRRLIL